MDWQEYQEAVALLYEQAEGLGLVRRNIYLPDKLTGQKRQVDVLVELESKGHRLTMLIDAKYRRARLDVKTVEEVLSLAEAVGANKAVVVAANGWTKPAEHKAAAVELDLRILTLDEALDLIVPDKWEICPGCEDDCIVNDHGGALQYRDGTILWWFGGQCRNCGLTFVWCQDCGQRSYFGVGETVTCDCGHRWLCDARGMRVKLHGTSRTIPI